MQNIFIAIFLKLVIYFSSQTLNTFFDWINLTWRNLTIKHLEDFFVLVILMWWKLLQCWWNTCIGGKASSQTATFQHRKFQISWHRTRCLCKGPIREDAPLQSLSALDIFPPTKMNTNVRDTYKYQSWSEEFSSNSIPLHTLIFSLSHKFYSSSFSGFLVYSLDKICSRYEGLAQILITTLYSCKLFFKKYFSLIPRIPNGEESFTIIQDLQGFGLANNDVTGTIETFRIFQVKTMS